MDINRQGRKSLIAAGGFIETSSSTGKYAFDVCATAYGLGWRFDRQGFLPDLVAR
jgi:Lipoxygenase